MARTLIKEIKSRRTVYLKDIKPSGTAGDTFTSGSWQTRDLNTIEGDSEIVSLSSNQFTLQPGKYEIESESQAYIVQTSKLRLQNITDGTTSIVGMTATQTGTASTSTPASLQGQIVLMSPKTFEVQHRCVLTNATDGFGFAASFGVDEVYTQVKITKVG